jgi:hypothetical protein
VLESRVLRGIFGLKNMKVIAGGRRKLHDEELHNLYTSPGTIKGKGKVSLVFFN